MPVFDVQLDSIDIPSFEMDFSETVGADYALVGSAVLPGPPRPSSLYTMTLNVYGDPSSPTFVTEGFTKRASLKSALQNTATRLAGLALNVSFDTALNGYIVIGTADISYAVGGPTFGDFNVKISNAVYLAAAQSLVALLPHGPVAPEGMTHDARRMMMVQNPMADAETVVPLPVGAYDVVRADGSPAEVTTYPTIYGPAGAVWGPQSGEPVRFRQAWEHRLHGQVRAFDTKGEKVGYTAAGDADPREYGFVQAYGPSWELTADTAPVLDNGRCRVFRAADGSLTVDEVVGVAYHGAGSVDLGYPDLVAAQIVELSPEHGVMKMTVRKDDHHRAEVYVTLGRGWAGPSVEIYHYGEPLVTGAEHRSLTVRETDRAGSTVWERWTLAAGNAQRPRVERRIIPV